MTDADLPPTWDWVQARAQCSVRQVFERLALGAQQNLATRTAQLPLEARSPRTVFRFEQRGPLFVVFTESIDGPIVRVQIEGARLVVASEDGTVRFHGTVTLDNRGRCRLRVDGEDLDEWQVLKRALEPVLFP